MTLYRSSDHECQECDMYLRVCFLKALDHGVRDDCPLQIIKGPADDWPMAYTQLEEERHDG